MLTEKILQFFLDTLYATEQTTPSSFETRSLTAARFSTGLLAINLIVVIFTIIYI